MLTTLVVGLLVGLSGCASSNTGPKAPGADVGQQVNAPLAAAVTDAPLLESNGKQITLASLSGKIIVLSDMMTLCQESCPLDTANVVAAARDVDRAGLTSKVVFMSVSIDPARDDLRHLAAYSKAYAPAPSNWVVAGGSSVALSHLWTTLGVYIQQTKDQPPLPKDWVTGRPLTYDLTHSDEVFFIDGQGHERFVLEGTPHVAADAPIPSVIKKFLDAEGRKNISDPDPMAWTLPQELQVLSWLTGHTITHHSDG